MNDERYFKADSKSDNSKIRDMIKVSQMVGDLLTELFRSLLISGDDPAKLVGGFTAAMGNTLGKLAVIDAMDERYPIGRQEALANLMHMARLNAEVIFAETDKRSNR